MRRSVKRNVALRTDETRGPSIARCGGSERGRERERESEREKERDRDRERDRETERDRERDRESERPGRCIDVSEALPLLGSKFLLCLGREVQRTAVRAPLCGLSPTVRKPTT